MRRAAVLLLLGLLALASCAGTSEATGGGRARPTEWPKFEKYEECVENATEMLADDVIVILPDFYAEDLELEGLSTGWSEVDGKRSWEGSGDCLLLLRRLKIRCRRLTVTLVPVVGEPEVMIQATGNITMGQRVKGVENWYDDLVFLHIRNDRIRMKQR